MSLIQHWSKLGRDYLERSKFAQAESPSVVAWGKMFRDFHGLSGGNCLILDVGSGTGIYLGKPYEDCRYNYYVGEKVNLDPFICVPVDDGVIGIGESLPFKSCLFDVVFCVSSLNHMIDHVKCIDEMFRVLKENGRLLIGAEADRGPDSKHLWFPDVNKLKSVFERLFIIKNFVYSKCMCMIDCSKKV